MEESHFVSELDNLNSVFLIRHGSYDRGAKVKDLTKEGVIEMERTSEAIAEYLGPEKKCFLGHSPVLRAVTSAQILHINLFSEHQYSIEKEEMQDLKDYAYFGRNTLLEVIDKLKKYDSVMLLTHLPNIEEMFPLFEKNGFLYDDPEKGQAYCFDYKASKTLILPTVGNDQYLLNL